MSIDTSIRQGMLGVNRTAANIWPVQCLVVSLSATMPTGGIFDVTYTGTQIIFHAIVNHFCKVLP